MVLSCTADSCGEHPEEASGAPRSLDTGRLNLGEVTEPTVKVLRSTGGEGALHNGEWHCGDLQAAVSRLFLLPAWVASEYSKGRMEPADSHSVGICRFWKKLSSFAGEHFQMSSGLASETMCRIWSLRYRPMRLYFDRKRCS